MLLCIEYGILFVDTVDMKIKACNALIAMFVLLHSISYRVMRCENCTLIGIKWPLTPAKREGYLKSLPSCRFSCSPVQGGSFVKRSLSCINSINIYSIDGMVEKPSVSAFQNFLWIEKQLNIKKVIDRNVWMCFDSSTDSLDKHSIQCIACFDLHIDSVDKKDTILNTQ